MAISFQNHNQDKDQNFPPQTKIVSIRKAIWKQTKKRHYSKHFTNKPHRKLSLHF